MELDEVLAGRDRMCGVLRRYLPPELARERSNNIAQVLGMVAVDPVDTVYRMLDGLGLSDVESIAAEAGPAWWGEAEPASDKVA